MSDVADVLLFILILCAPRLLALAIVSMVCRLSARYDAYMTPQHEEQGTPC